MRGAPGMGVGVGGCESGQVTLGVGWVGALRMMGAMPWVHMIEGMPQVHT